MGFFIQFFAEFVVLRAFRFMTKDILYLLWFLRLTQSERSKKSQFPKLEQFFLSNFSTFAWKMLIFMGYLWFNKYAYLFLFQKGAKIQNFCLFARYTNIFIFHLNLMSFFFLWIECNTKGLQVVKQWISSIKVSELNFIAVKLV